MPDEPTVDETQGGPPVEEGPPPQVHPVHDPDPFITIDDFEIMDAPPATPAAEPPNWMRDMIRNTETIRSSSEDSERQPEAKFAGDIVPEMEMTHLMHSNPSRIHNAYPLRKIIIYHKIQGWLKLDINGRKRWVQKRENAQIFDIDLIYNYVSCGSPDYVVWLMPYVPPPPGCKLTDWFDGGFITLMHDAPNNNVMRAHMMRVLKVEPPKDRETFEALKDWVEKTFPKPPKRDVRNQSSISILAPVEVGPGIQVVFRLTQREEGRMRYSVLRKLSHRMTLNVAEIEEIINAQDCHNMSELMAAIKDNAWETNHGDWEYGDYDYDDTSADPDNHSREMTSSDPSDLEARIRTLLQEQSPETLRELENNNE